MIQKKKGKNTLLKRFSRNFFTSYFLVRRREPLTVKKSGTPIRVNENMLEQNSQLLKSCENSLVRCPITTSMIANERTSSKYNMRLGLILINITNNSLFVRINKDI